MECRICASVLDIVLDYGEMPLANNHQKSVTCDEVRYPLQLCWCRKCELLQHPNDVEPSELFQNYQYFSSISKDYVSSRRRIANKLCSAFDNIGNFSVCEIACNDGYFLSEFVDRAEIVVGFEPAVEPSKVAKSLGINVISDFFDFESAKKYREENDLKFELVLANNVLAHCPNLLSVLEGIEHVLSDSGLFICEFPAAEQMLENALFDTVYHEHFFYFTLNSFRKIASKAGLKILFSSIHPEHGVSHRIGLVRQKCIVPSDFRSRFIQLFQSEIEINSHNWFIDSFRDDVNAFNSRVNRVCLSFIEFLEAMDREDKRVGFIGAAAKGNSLLNYLASRYDRAGTLIGGAVGVLDETPAKAGRFFSGTNLKILSLDDYVRERADVHVVLIWNHAVEVKRRYASLLKGDLVVLMPDGLRVL